MKRSITIGFDARYAMSDHEEFGRYSRLVIEAMALAAPRYTYFRSYVPLRAPHLDYERIEQLHNIETMEPDGAIWRKLRLPWRIWHVANDLHNGNVELYHGLAGHIPMCLDKHNIRSVVTIHNMEFLYDNTFANSPEHLLTRIYMGRMLHRVDRIVAVSECVKRDITKHFRIYPEKVDVIYPGVAKRYNKELREEYLDAVREKYNLPKNYMLSVGMQLERRSMIKVVNILPLIDNETHYVIVGRTTSHTTRLKRAAQELGVSNRLHIIEHIPEEDMPALYRNASVLINLSRYEGFATHIAEAMAVGTPVITTRSSSMEEVADNAALYINPNNRDELVNAIHLLTDGGELRQILTTLGRRQVTRFRPEVVAYNLINCYRRLDVDIRG
jgi:glycosyltransferase involved in cell wall biosynthesis